MARTRYANCFVISLRSLQFSLITICFCFVQRQANRQVSLHHNRVPCKSTFPKRIIIPKAQDLTLRTTSLTAPSTPLRVSYRYAKANYYTGHHTLVDSDQAPAPSHGPCHAYLTILRRRATANHSLDWLECEAGAAIRIKKLFQTTPVQLSECLPALLARN
ncbi:hypothetical protein K458DRAFT_431276 [Lentithecium fluviatile CBS 122367]|uniref:Uncharacterized protein n=1 Tax=Lentithecium fluviatile CBS 122367 TaxID=1168545 RepID=A0A6G1J1A6_9PLEO|nr:hypothetical protein K458DRAFT_431276 [Lentithecium fluviatile CBS 122367]